jgi:hypothetical protein
VTEPASLVRTGWFSLGTAKEMQQERDGKEMLRRRNLMQPSKNSVRTTFKQQPVHLITTRTNKNKMAFTTANNNTGEQERPNTRDGTR